PPATYTLSLHDALPILTRSPRLLALGLVPGVISLLVVLTALGTLFYFINDVAAVVTWFADDWSKDARNAIRLVAAVAIGLVSVIVAVLTFTALTLTIGDPF